MPSTTTDERQAKRRHALVQIAYIDTKANPCLALYSQVDARRRYDDWVRLVRLQGVMESLWPNLSGPLTEGEFAAADRYSARLAKDPLFGLHRLYRPQAWEYRGRIMLDYGLWGSQNSMSRHRMLGLYDEALWAYDAAAVLYEALPDSEDYSITYLQMRGYRGEVLFAMNRLDEAGCIADWARMRAMGSEPKVRKFRRDMNRLLNKVDIEGSAYWPAACDSLGLVITTGRAWSWWNVGVVVLVLLFLLSLSLSASASKKERPEKVFFRFKN